ncbi:MAG TPA: response regulator [Puia sp.]|nr:response regulator [Puia sp.]
MKTLLIVDDSPIIIDRLRNMLEGVLLPHQLRHAGSYVEALSLLLVKVPDIILLDINLPDKSGIEVLKLVKSRYPEVTVIMITNQSDPSYRSVCAALGAHRFLDKSTEFEGIPDLIASLL